jgi:hypothetical protein
MSDAVYMHSTEESTTRFTHLTLLDSRNENNFRPAFAPSCQQKILTSLSIVVSERKRMDYLTLIYKAPKRNSHFLCLLLVHSEKEYPVLRITNLISRL